MNKKMNLRVYLGDDRMRKIGMSVGMMSLCNRMSKKMVLSERLDSKMSLST